MTTEASIAAGDSAGRLRRAQHGDTPDVGAVGGGIDLEWVPEVVLGACRVALRSLSGGGATGALAVTSSLREEGRSTIALGAALVQRLEYERHTVLLDLDFARPSLARTLHLPGQPGLADVLRGDASLYDSLAWPYPQLGVACAGEVDDPLALLHSFRRSSVLEELLNAGYVVVADLPPLPPAGRADRVVEMFWDVFLVIRAGVTSVRAVQAALDSLATPPAVILNGKSSAVPRWLRKPMEG